MFHTVIMAGGGGTRLWPLSTPETPKQYLKLTGEHTMLGMTLDRVADITGPDSTWIVTMEDQVESVRRNAGPIDQDRILLEPMARNTAAAIGLAAIRISLDDPDAILAVLPADHLIRDVPVFQKCLKDGEAVARETDAIVTIGIHPTRPETGYGYIERASGDAIHGAVPVKRFREKPNRDTAEEFVEAGVFYWNAGIFIASAKRLLAELAEHVPTTHQTLVKIGKAFDAGNDDEVRRLYETLEPISIDYAVMEHAKNVRVIPAEFDWSDVGGYEELLRISRDGEDGNYEKGVVHLDGVEDSYVRNELDLPLAVIGMDNVVVVATRDGILVTTPQTSQHVKSASEWADRLRKNKS
jgi:mannose-1-phosphate guanylyltransferase